MPRLALLISGGGTTAAFLLKEIDRNRLNVTPVLVIASRDNISGIKRIRDTGFNKKDIVVIDPKKFKTADGFADRLVMECSNRNVDFIGQYGWLPKTPAKFIKVYQRKIINQHPGPLDDSGVDFGGKGMYGRRVHAAVLYFRRVTNHDYWTEATTHIVTSEFDKGDVIGRIKVPLSEDETVESLREKLLPVEHMLQLRVLKMLSAGSFKKLRRSETLIKKSEHKVLNSSKEIAQILYPKG